MLIVKELQLGIDGASSQSHNAHSMIYLVEIKYGHAWETYAVYKHEADADVEARNYRTLGHEVRVRQSVLRTGF